MPVSLALNIPAILCRTFSGSEPAVFDASVKAIYAGLSSLCALFLKERLRCFGNMGRRVNLDVKVPVVPDFPMHRNLSTGGKMPLWLS